MSSSATIFLLFQGLYGIQSNGVFFVFGVQYKILLRWILSGKVDGHGLDGWRNVIVIMMVFGWLWLEYDGMAIGLICFYHSCLVEKMENWMSFFYWKHDYMIDVIMKWNEWNLCRSIRKIFAICCNGIFCWKWENPQIWSRHNINFLTVILGLFFRWRSQFT